MQKPFWSVRIRLLSMHVIQLVNPIGAQRILTSPAFAYMFVFHISRRMSVQATASTIFAAMIVLGPFLHLHPSTICPSALGSVCSRIAANTRMHPADLGWSPFSPASVARLGVRKHIFVRKHGPSEEALARLKSLDASEQYLQYVDYKQFELIPTDILSKGEDAKNGPKNNIAAKIKRRLEPTIRLEMWNTNTICECERRQVFGAPMD